MFAGADVVSILEELEFTHIVWIPDSTLGQWEAAFRDAPSLELVGVCREGEAWTVAAGLFLGGANPVVIIQCTGMFESGDALRNVLHDYGIPLFALIGYRSYFNQETLPGDTALKFTEPILKAWELDYRLIDSPEKRQLIIDHCRACRRETKPGVALIAEGRA